MKKILHLASDEKFIDSANWLFEKVAPKANTFIIFVSKGHLKLKYVTKKDNIEILESNRKNIKSVITGLNEYDIVVLHSLRFLNSRIVLKSKYERINFFWIFWGAEIYDNRFAFKEDFIGYKTCQHFPKPKDNILIGLLRKLKYSFLYGLPVPDKSILEAAKKIEYFGSLHLEDYTKLKENAIITENTKHIRYNYYPIEFIFKDNEKIRIKGNDFLIGNSSIESNNHLEIFDLLKNIGIGNRKVIVPLSYGKKDYASKVVEIGKKQIGSNFLPLLEFLPLNDYNRTIQNCGIVIMNHYRQQAVGNIIAMMWMGSKIYLDDQNTFFQYLKRIGCFVYSIKSDLKKENRKVFSLLTENEVAHNRKILIEEAGQESIIKSLKYDLLKTITKI